MALNVKQQAFVREYLVDLNATQAAIRAGYSRNTARAQGHDLLTHPDISQEIASAMHERSVRTEITADMVLRELAKIGFADIRRAVRWSSADEEPEVAEEQDPQPHGGTLRRMRARGGTQVELVPSDLLDPETAAAISEISQTPNGVKVKFHDKRGALMDIGKHLGMFIDRQALVNTDGADVQLAPVMFVAVEAKPQGDDE